MSNKLFIFTGSPMTFPEALAAFSVTRGEKQAMAILYSPQECQLATLEAGKLQRSCGKAVDLSLIFEARVFHDGAELRWLNDPGPRAAHRATLLAEEDLVSSLGDGWKTAEPLPLDVVDVLEQTYLLWGKGTGDCKCRGETLADGWSKLATPQIGALPVPKVVAKDQRVLLQSREYLVAKEHGNVIVFDERLIGLEVADGR